MSRGARTVYFIKPVGMEGPVKIGCSQSPDGRRETLSSWSPFALEIVAEIEGDTTLERRFHAKFMPQHLRREWFAPSAELAEVIASINTGTFDESSLPNPRKIPGRFGRKKWTDEQREAVKRRHAVRKLERSTNLICPSEEHWDQFLADPQSCGVPREERERMWRDRQLAYAESAAADAQARLEQARKLVA